MTATDERLAYTAEEVSKMLGLSERAVTRMARNGDLPAIKPGGRWLFPRRRLDAFLNGELPEAIESATRG